MSNIKSLFPNKIKPKQNQQQVRINVDELTDILCIKCGNPEFLYISRLKYLPATLSPNAKPNSININMAKCIECGWIFDIDAYKKYIDLKEENVSQNENNQEVSSEEKNTSENDNRDLCRKCGLFFDKGTEHKCK